MTPTFALCFRSSRAVTKPSPTLPLRRVLRLRTLRAEGQGKTYPVTKATCQIARQQRPSQASGSRTFPDRSGIPESQSHLRENSG